MAWLAYEAWISRDFWLAFHALGFKYINGSQYPLVFKYPWARTVRLGFKVGKGSQHLLGFHQDTWLALWTWVSLKSWLASAFWIQFGFGSHAPV